MTKEKIDTIISVIVLVANDLESKAGRAREMPLHIFCSFSSLIQHIVETIMTYDAVTSSIYSAIACCQQMHSQLMHEFLNCIFLRNANV